MTPVKLFFGEAGREFALHASQITELERSCNAPIGTICNRVFHRQFSQTDISETIRLGMIATGEHPKRAAELVALYVTGRPFTETYPIASAILDGLWFGEPHEKATK